MPPRKKTADGDAPAAPTRTSSRTKANVPAPDVTKAKADPKPKKAAGKKRARADSEGEQDDTKDDEDQPAPSKKSKADDEAEVEEEKKMVTVLKRGGAAIDPFSGNSASHQVYQNTEDIWDARLNQTDIGNNNNKFYMLQLQHPLGNSNSCTLFTHWGRLGENGQKQAKGPWDPATAISEFKKQFKAKTGVNWEDKVGMTTKKGKYLWLAPADEEEVEEDEKGDSRPEELIPESTLPVETQTLCKLIFNDQIIKNTLSEMNYDANKLPLGKLSKSTIALGFGALKKLAEVLEEPTGALAKQYPNVKEALKILSGEYYSVIPHAFGRAVPATIDEKQILKKELELLETLRDMEIAQKMISKPVTSGPPVNPIDAHFQSLGLSCMDPVQPDSKEFKSLETYARDTHGRTHMHYQAKVLNAFRVERENETHAWNNSPQNLNNLKEGERLLLWHGSRSTNFAGILSQGLRIAPPEAPVTGYMFGKGVYFADMMSKSANYCHAYMSQNTGILLLCEVAAQPFHELEHSDYYADEGCKQNNKLCTKGVGKTQPSAWQDAGQALDNPDLHGVHMPLGPAQDQQIGGYLQYNEYIVYDAAQIRVRYLLMVEMK